MKDRRPEPAGPLALLQELTEFLEGLLTGMEEEATDLLTNEGEDLVATARAILSKFQRTCRSGPGQPVMPGETGSIPAVARKYPRGGVELWARPGDDPDFPIDVYVVWGQGGPGLEQYANSYRTIEDARRDYPEARIPREMLEKRGNGKYRATGVFELRGRVRYEDGTAEEVRCPDFAALARLMEQHLERFDFDIGVIRQMTLVVDPIE